MLLRTVFLSVAAVAVCAASATAIELKEIAYDTQKGGKVVFSHKVHMKQKGITGSCKSCHSQVFPLDRKIHATMAQMEQGKSCGACHDGKRAFPLSSCARCHQVKDVAIQVPATGPVRFSHARHTGKFPDCASCHEKLFRMGSNHPVGMAAMEKGKSCGACHNGKRAFAVARCAGCHPTKEVKFQIAATGPLTFSHKKHIAKSSCAACHNKLYTIGNSQHVSMKEMEKGKSCGACHNGKTAFALAKCGGCHQYKDKVYAVKQTGPLPFKHAKHLRSLSCDACHGKVYALGAKHRPAVTMAQMEKGASCGSCHNGGVAFGLRNCGACHPVKKIAFKVKPVTASFNHTKHLFYYDCTACHAKIYKPQQGGPSYTMAQMEQGKSCGACHNDQRAFTVAGNCGKCHDIDKKYRRVEHAGL
ncbi:cytochrome c3 family protein [Geomesophilobacter sediminis]|uniref:cytochrome c3 family protein n=1 Tax=Geomesophilobacter sediminis TaxID=2798584 RepID=UPI001F2E4920|nr:cytochrome c3 family protein [Geomesophilobacter sediminis]